METTATTGDLERAFTRFVKGVESVPKRAVARAPAGYVRHLHRLLNSLSGHPLIL
jgi:hypothetical protein